jgi:uncharacterized protein YndB with AHSA1/START domain
MWKTIGLILLVAIFGFFGYVAMQPRVNTITRSATLSAPPSAVFPYINDFHKWQEWSPWAKLDPNAKSTFEGPQSGVGSAFTWAGNSEVGEGKMTIAESKPDEQVKMRLDFVKPFANTSDATFDLKPEGAGTHVTWSMTGEAPFFVRAMCILFRANKAVEGMFDKGLANLGTVSANPAASAGAAPKP